MTNKLLLIITSIIIGSISSNYCFAQNNTPVRPTIQIGAGDSTISLDDKTMMDIMQNTPVAGLSYYEVEAIFKVLYISEDSSMRIIDVEIDSVISVSPVGWTDGIFQLTICEWADTKGLGRGFSNTAGERFHATLTSIRPIRFAGHGEEYILVVNREDDKKRVEIPRSRVKNKLMRFSEDLTTY